MALTKAEIQQRLREGTGRVAHVDAPELGGGQLAVRPLTQAELDRVDAVETRGLSMGGGSLSLEGLDTDGEEVTPDELRQQLMRQLGSGGLTMDLGEATEAQAEANRIRVAAGLSVDEDWTDVEVGALPPALFARVLSKVEEISDTPASVDAARMFRDDPSGGDDGDAGDARESAGGDAG